MTDVGLARLRRLVLTNLEMAGGGALSSAGKQEASRRFARGPSAAGRNRWRTLADRRRRGYDIATPAQPGPRAPRQRREHSGEISRPRVEAHVAGRGGGGPPGRRTSCACAGPRRLRRSLQPPGFCHYRPPPWKPGNLPRPGGPGTLPLQGPRLLPRPSHPAAGRPHHRPLRGRALGLPVRQSRDRQPGTFPARGPLSCFPARPTRPRRLPSSAPLLRFHRLNGAALRHPHCPAYQAQPQIPVVSRRAGVAVWPAFSCVPVGRRPPPRHRPLAFVFRCPLEEPT